MSFRSGESRSRRAPADDDFKNSTLQAECFPSQHEYQMATSTSTPTIEARMACQPSNAPLPADRQATTVASTGTRNSNTFSYGSDVNDRRNDGDTFQQTMTQPIEYRRVDPQNQRRCQRELRYSHAKSNHRVSLLSTQTDESVRPGAFHVPGPNLVCNQQIPRGIPDASPPISAPQEEESQRNVPNANPLDEEQIQVGQPVNENIDDIENIVTYKKRLLSVLVFPCVGILFAAVVIVIVVVLASRNQQAQQQNTSTLFPPTGPLTENASDDEAMPNELSESPASSPTDEQFSERFEAFFQVLGPSITINGDRLRSTTTPQHQSLVWLADEDPGNLDIDTTPISVLLERYVMKLFHNVTSGDGWYDESNFLSAGAVCEWRVNKAAVVDERYWQGVTCHDGDDVSIREIRIHENNLVGEIPPELGLLANLTDLVLQKNFLSGTIPTELFMIPRLEVLGLSSNRDIIGTIPSEIGQLSNSLISFSGAETSLSGSAPFEHFLQMTNSLESFTIGGSNFQGWSIPTEIGYFSKLTRLDLSSSRLTGTIPSEIGSCTSLTYLSLDSNSALIGTIPTSLGQMTNLHILRLDDAKLSGMIPNELGNCTSMRSMTLSDNPDLYGTIPTSIGQMSDLTTLFLHSIPLTGTVPSEFVNLSKLTSFRIDGSDITGSFNSIFCGIDPDSDIDENSFDMICDEARSKWEVLQADCFDVFSLQEVECCCCDNCRR